MTEVCLEYLIGYSNEALYNSITKRDPKFNYNLSRTKFYNYIEGMKASLLTKQNIEDIKNLIQHEKEKCIEIPDKSVPGLLHKYELITDETSGTDMLLAKQSNSILPSLSLVSIENVFDVLFDQHLKFNHNNEATKDFVKVKYFIPDEIIEVLNDSCNICSMKKKNTKHSPTGPLHVTRTAQTETKQVAGASTNKVSTDSLRFNDRVYLGFVDMRWSPDHDFYYLMYYVDLKTTYILFRPLIHIGAVRELATELLQIFLDFGAPKQILTEKDAIVTTVLKIIKCAWPIFDVELIKNQGQIPVKPSQVLDLIEGWITENHSKNWAVGCRLIQYKLNSMLEDNCSPYKSIFNFEPHYKPTEKDDQVNIDSNTIIDQPIETNLMNILPNISPDSGEINDNSIDLSKDGAVIDVQIEIDDPSEDENELDPR